MLLMSFLWHRSYFIPANLMIHYVSQKGHQRHHFATGTQRFVPVKDINAAGRASHNLVFKMTLKLRVFAEVRMKYRFLNLDK